MEIKVHEELNGIITAAFAEAKNRSHEYITPEHVLYASLFFASGRDILYHCGADINILKKDLEAFLKGDNIQQVEDKAPVESLGFHNVIQNAMLHVASSGKDMLETGDILAALFSERESYAVAFLQKQGVTRLLVLEYISHGISPMPEGDIEEADLEDEDDDGDFLEAEGYEEDEEDEETVTKPGRTKKIPRTFHH